MCLIIYQRDRSTLWLQKTYFRHLDLHSGFCHLFFSTYKYLNVLFIAQIIFKLFRSWMNNIIFVHRGAHCILNWRKKNCTTLCGTQFCISFEVSNYFVWYFRRLIKLLFQTTLSFFHCNVTLLSDCNHAR